LSRMNYPRTSCGPSGIRLTESRLEVQLGRMFKLIIYYDSGSWLLNFLITIS